MTNTAERQIAAEYAHLIVCPTCDALYRVQAPNYGEVLVCQRCKHTLAVTRKHAGMQIVCVSLAMLILVIAACFVPFVDVTAAGIHSGTSLINVALSFSEGLLFVLTLITVGTIVVVPALRALLLIYVIGPIVFDRPPARGARRAFRVAEALKPWAMAEIFAIGCAVSLVKIGDMATVEFGPAFWLFGLVVVLVVVHDRILCSWSVWNAITLPQVR